MNGANIIVVDEDLTPGNEYSYIVYFLMNNEIADSSNIVDLTTQPSEEFLGLDGKLITHLAIIQNHLYTGTLYEGLWRLDIMSDLSQWEYLGFSNTEVGYDKYSISDIVQNRDNHDEILVVGPTNRYSIPGVFKSRDGGASWNISDEGAGSFPSKQKFQVLDDRILAWGSSGPWFSTDFGDHWSFDSSVVTAGGFKNIDAFEKHETIDTHLWLAGDDFYMVGHLLKSIDSGTEWISIPFDDQLIFGIRSIALHPTNTEIIYIVTSGDIYKATDGGEFWMQSGLNAATPITHSQLSTATEIVIDSSNPDHLIAAGGNRLFETFDAADTWKELMTIIPVEDFITGLRYNAGTKQLYVATNSGVYVQR